MICQFSHPASIGLVKAAPRVKNLVGLMISCNSETVVLDEYTLDNKIAHMYSLTIPYTTFTLSMVYRITNMYDSGTYHSHI